MTQDRDTLARYALAYIKKSGSTSGIEDFLKTCNQDWSEENFENEYKNFRQNSSNRRNASQQPGTDPAQATQHDSPNGGNTGQPYSQSPHQPQPTHNHHHHYHHENSRLDFWDYVLLQCWIDSLLSSRSNQTTNTTYINYGNANINNGNTNNEDEKEKSKSDRQLLALGMVALAVVIIFHGSICYFYNSSKKQAREEGKIDYLDNQLKMFRNIEFAGCAVSLIALIACAVYPVLPVWGLIALGINSIVCAVGGWAFQMKHEKESENIENAKSVVNQYLQNITTQPPSYAEATATPSAPLLY